MRLEGKVALVTGAGNGIGRATAMRFAEEGAIVIATDIDLAAAESTATAIEAGGGVAEARQQDVCDEALWPSLIAESVSTHGALHVLVNNAGIVLPNNVENASLEEWRMTNAVNSEAVFLGCRAAIEVMKECGGSIINISSIEGIVGEANAAAYNASKGAVRIFTKSVALHCARSGYPIRANSVHPGFIMTEMVAQGLASVPQEVREEMEQRLGHEIPGGEMGSPEDIANGCLFLASDESRYMTGAELVIDGGYTCH